MKKISIYFSRLFVGLLFIFSGFIKANDPLGFGYKLQEYFEVFQITFLNDFATAIAIFLCGLEIVLGTALLLGIYARKVIWGLLALIIFFTFLTFYSAFFEVVSSCGCFGDAIPLTPWQSFGKDLILLAFILILFIYRKEINPIVRPKIQNIAAAIALIFGFGFGIHSYAYGPILDFLPYKVGANIPELMKAPPGAPQDEYEITYSLKNKQTGAALKLTDKEYLKQEIWKDTNWEIEGEPESKLVKKGYEIKIKDLKITDAEENDYTNLFVEFPGYQLVVVAYDLGNTHEQALASINDIAKRLAEKHRIGSIILTSSASRDARAIKDRLALQPEIYFADAIPLKSMVRANPGVLLMKNGRVINKWHFRTFPDYVDLENKYFN